jgi:nucleoside-diphosphate-sugar epimerase
MFQLPQNIVLEQAVHPLSQIYDLAGRMLSVETLTSAPQELAPGKLFYDTWQVSLICEQATAQLFVSLGQSFPAAGLIAICDDGLIHADFVHQRVLAQSATRWPEFYHGFYNGLSLAKAASQQSLRTAGRYILSTLRLLPRSDPFFLGIKRSIAAFYRAVDRNEPLVDGAVGAAVVSMCERVSQGVAVGAAPAATDTVVKLRAHPSPYDALVIGGTGFIGSHLIEKMLSANLRVRVLARNTHLLPALFHDPRVETISGDIANAPIVRQAIGDIPVVIHLAHGGLGDSWEEIERSMIAGTRNIAEACLEQGAKRLIYTGTIASLYLGDASALVTGSAGTDPQIEKRGLYARGKAACEELLNQMRRERHLPVCILRPGVVLGKGGSPFHSGFGQFNREAHCLGWNRGDHPLPLVLAEDVAEAILLAMRAEGIEGKSYNVVGDLRLSAREYFSELSRALGRPLRYHPQSPLKLQLLEIGKWVIKIASGRKGAPFPSYRDLKSRGLVSQFDCSDIKRDLHWTPTQDRAEFIRRGLAVHRRKRPVDESDLAAPARLGAARPRQ